MSFIQPDKQNEINEDIKKMTRSINVLSVLVLSLSSLIFIYIITL